MLHCYWPGITILHIAQSITLLRCPVSSVFSDLNTFRYSWRFLLFLPRKVASCFARLFIQNEILQQIKHYDVFPYFLIFPSSSLHPSPPSAIFDNPVGRLKFSAQCSVNWAISPGQWWAIDHVKGEISITWIPASGGECLASPPPPLPPPSTQCWRNVWWVERAGRWSFYL